MHAETSVLIRAPLGEVYEVVSSVERWPELFPQYRAISVRSEVGRCRLVEVAARSGVIPLRWLAVQELHPDVPEIAFHHVRGLTRGLAVEWSFEPRPAGVWVTMRHELHLPRSGIARLAAERVVAPLYVRLVSRRTLACLKDLAEARRAARRLQVARGLRRAEAPFEGQG